MVKVYKFWAEWCGPCKASQPNWNTIKALFDNDTRVSFIEVDTEDTSDPNYGLMEKYAVTSLPTFVAVNEDSGEYLDIRGIASVEALRIIVNHALRH